jgi:DNA-binding response OmpR family regulator
MTGAPYILLVDDDPELRQSLVDLLEDEGFRTRSAASGREALAMLRDPDLPRLILLDLMMPDMNGWEFCELKSHDARIAHVPVLVVTAARSVMQAPIGAEVLFKPFSLDEVLEKVRRLGGWAGAPSELGLH